PHPPATLAHLPLESHLFAPRIPKYCAARRIEGGPPQAGKIHPRSPLQTLFHKRGAPCQSATCANAAAHRAAPPVSLSRPDHLPYGADCSEKCSCAGGLIHGNAALRPPAPRVVCCPAEAAGMLHKACTHKADSAGD